MSTSTALAIPSKVQPKPTKAEVIDALTELETDRRIKENKRVDEEWIKLEKEIKKQIHREFKVKSDPDPAISLGYIRDKENKIFYGLSIEFEVVPSEALKDKLLKYHDKPRRLNTEKHIVRHEILAKANGVVCGDRVSRLLDDPESRKALDAMLASII